MRSQTLGLLEVTVRYGTVRYGNVFCVTAVDAAVIPVGCKAESGILLALKWDVARASHAVLVEARARQQLFTVALVEGWVSRAVDVGDDFRIHPQRQPFECVFLLYF